MMRVRLGVMVLVLAACTDGVERSPEPSPQIPPEPEPEPVTRPLDELIADALLIAARDYWRWGRVDEIMRVAPAPCADPNTQILQTGVPSHIRRSRANDSEHGQKLYYLFAGLDGYSARDHYVGLEHDPSPIPLGFTIVKESWKAASEPNASIAKPKKTTLTPEPVTFVLHRDQPLYIGEQAELFIMIKLGPPDLEGTDAGWIYGTVTADGRIVTSMGKVEPCMDCHEAAPHERLFGLQTTRALVDIPNEVGDRTVSLEQLGLERANAPAELTPP